MYHHLNQPEEAKACLSAAVDIEGGKSIISKDLNKLLGDISAPNHK